MITVDSNLCPQDHKCPAIKICPVDAIEQINFELPTIDHEKCINCMKCTKFCPKDALKSN